MQLLSAMSSIISTTKKYLRLFHERFKSDNAVRGVLGIDIINDFQMFGWFVEILILFG